MSDRFAFGENWKNFVEKHFSEERAATASNNLLQSLQLQNLEGMRFLDIGCGSGLHSLAAWRAGASHVCSFDYDVNSVDTTKALWRMAGQPENWTVQQGSVLDAELMSGLGKFDIVYSWGVLHHTGDMWAAIRNAAIPVACNGVFFVALYSDTTYRDGSWSNMPTPEQWLHIKQSYNAASPLRKRYMECKHVWRNYFAPVRCNPLKFLRAGARLARDILTYKQSRGMEFWTDVRDWMGGWPMEFVKEQDYIRVCAEELGLEPLRLNTGEGNTEFLFRPKDSHNYWDHIISQRQFFPLPEPVTHEAGQMFSVKIPSLGNKNTVWERRKPSTLTLFEDGFPLAYRCAQKIGIEKGGSGRYLHCENTLYFSSSDLSDPRHSGRSYTYCMEP
jgi:SAM-dependent methyltransferase